MHGLIEGALPFRAKGHFSFSRPLPEIFAGGGPPAEYRNFRREDHHEDSDSARVSRPGCLSCGRSIFNRASAAAARPGSIAVRRPCHFGSTSVINPGFSEKDFWSGPRYSFASAGEYRRCDQWRRRRSRSGRPHCGQLERCRCTDILQPFPGDPGQLLAGHWIYRKDSAR